MSTGTWDDVLTAALLGTDRRTLDPADLPQELGALGAKLPGTDAPGRLLGAAVLLTTVRRAGAGVGAPGTAPPPPAPAAPETARVVGVAARERLAGLLTRADGEGAAMLAEWLRLAAERSLVAPPALLPPLLDLATRRRDVAGDDDIQIDLRSDNKLHVYYLNPINVSTAHP